MQSYYIYRLLVDENLDWHHWQHLMLYSKIGNAPLSWLTYLHSLLPTNNIIANNWASVMCKLFPAFVHTYRNMGNNLRVIWSHTNKRLYRAHYRSASYTKPATLFREYSKITCYRLSIRTYYFYRVKLLQWSHQNGLMIEVNFTEVRKLGL